MQSRAGWRSWVHIRGWLCLLLMAAGCQEEVVPPGAGRTLSDYFPVATGDTRLYTVTDSLFPFAGGQRRESLLRETVGEPLPDLLNRQVFLLRRDTGAVDATALAPATTWRHYVDQAVAEVVEGNERVVVLNAPIQRQTVWNGNRLNNRNADVGTTLDTLFRYLDLDTTVTVRGETFANCILVQHRRSRPGTLLSDIWTYTVYAPGIGKVLFVDRYYLYQSTDPNRQPESGSYLHIEEYLTDD